MSWNQENYNEIQDGIIVQSLFLPLFAQVVSWFWILVKAFSINQNTINCVMTLLPFLK